MKLWIIKWYDNLTTKAWWVNLWKDLTARNMTEPVIPGETPQQPQEEVPATTEETGQVSEPSTEVAPEAEPEQAVPDSTSTDQALAAAGVKQSTPVAETPQPLAPEKASLLQRAENWTEEEWDKFKDFVTGKAVPAVEEIATTSVGPLESVLTTLEAHKADIVNKVETAIPGFIEKLTLAVVNEADAIETKIKTEVDNISTIKTAFNSAVKAFETLI